MFDMLQVMLASLKASVKILAWSMFMLVMIMLTCSIFLYYTLEPWMLDESNSEADRHQAFEYFGTFSRSMLSMFELTIGNWIPISRFLHNQVSEWFGPFLLIYQCTICFAVVTVIRGIFLHETFQVANADDELMIMNKERQIKKHTRKMHQFLAEADDSGDGLLSREEFRSIVADSRVKAWLGSMELDVRDADLVYSLVDADLDGLLTPEELVRGFSLLRGPARSLDMVTSMRTVDQKLTAVKGQLQSLSDRLAGRVASRGQI